MLVFSSDGKVVGKIVDDTLEKTVSSKKHMLRNPPSWGYDVDIIDKAMKAGVKFLKIHDVETGNVYTTSMEKFRTYSFKQNRGYGPQSFLPISRWDVSAPKEQLQMF